MSLARLTFAQNHDEAWARVFSVLLFVMLYRVIVTIAYGASGAATLSEAAQLQSQVAGGDSQRQIIFIAISLITIFLTLRRNGLPSYLPFSIAYLLACMWAIGSFVWAIDPAISFRRSIGMFVVFVAVCTCVMNLGARRTIAVMYYFFTFLTVASIVAVSLSSIELFSFAVHPDYEGDPALIGAWKGLMMHKNVSGAIMVHAAIFFFHHLLQRKTLIDFALFSLCVIFLLKTGSKMPFGWFSLVLVFSLVYRQLFIKRVRILFSVFCLMLFGLGLMGYFLFQEDIVKFFQDPDSLTGRTQIWWSLMPYIEQHWLLGSGYGSFWSIGDRSPIYQLALTDFIATIGHSHSGYVEIVLTTGIVGLGLVIIAIAVLPYWRFISAPIGDAKMNGMFAGMWLFGLLQNFTEAQIFSPDKQSWMLVTICICITHCRAMERRLGRVSQLEATCWPPANRDQYREAANTKVLWRQPQ